MYLGTNLFEIIISVVSTTRRRLGPGLLLAVLAVILLVPVTGRAQRYSALQHEAIQYYTTEPTDDVAMLQKRIEAGEVVLEPDENGSFLSALLDALNIDVSSQLLVASKTSLQLDNISPATPRAVYFNDEVYVGWIQGSPLLEITSVDPRLGAVFYGLEETVQPVALHRETDVCLQCHNPESPSHVMTSVVPDQTGLPVYHAGLFVTSDQSPLEERWGGWYVTGTHGGQMHMGNLITEPTGELPGLATRSVSLDRAQGANVTDLSMYIDTSPYLSRHSDIVALMVMGHQIHVSNLITHLGYETRKSAHGDGLAAEEVAVDGSQLSEASLKRIEDAAESLVEGMLLSHEVELTAPITGTSGFTDYFANLGPWDRLGRSLRHLDLDERLFRYPLSHLIYSRSFDNLPPIAKDRVYRRLEIVLSGEDESGEFEHLSSADLTAIREILEETKPEYAAWLERQTG